MRAAVIHHFGPPSAFAIEERPVPEPNDEEVLVRLHGAGVGIWDVQIRSGAWGAQGDFPLILGTDGAGVVAQAGSASGFAPGENVWVYDFGAKKGGCYAEFTCAPSSCVGRVPADVRPAEASGAATVLITAWCGIRDVLEVGPRDVVLVHGATGGVGLAAVQLAAWTGAQVVATASHDADTLRSLGAAAVYDARKTADRTSLNEVLPHVTKMLLTVPFVDAESGARLPPGSRVAYPNGVEGPAWRSEASAFDGVPTRERWDAIGKSAEGRGFRMPVARAFPLEEVAAAHGAVARGGHFGKIALAYGS